MLDLSTSEIQFAIKAVRQACSLSSQIQSEMTASELNKGDKSPVTVADFAVQALVAKHLVRRFPGDVLVAEESSEALQKPEGEEVTKQVLSFLGRFISDFTKKQVFEWIDRGNGKPGNHFWTLDPIDGTKGFLRGDQYAVGLSLVRNHRVELTVIGCPNLSEIGEPDVGGYGSIAIAVLGQGAWIASLKEEEPEFKRLKVSQVRELSEAKMLRSVVAAHTNTSRTDAFMKKISNKVEPLYMDSLAKYVALAAGKGEFFFYLVPEKNPDYRMKIWDVTPGYLLVKEAGGKMTDVRGGDIDFSAGLTIAKNPGLVMTNGLLHESILQALQASQAV